MSKSYITPDWNSEDPFSEGPPQGKKLGKIGKNVVARYAYEDRNGHLHFEVHRHEQGDDKYFTQHAVDADGDLLVDRAKVNPFLYRISEVVEAKGAGEWIYVPEGEKDVETLRSLGKVATCNPGGAGKWNPDYARTFKGAKVCILSDKDDAGRKHARDIYDSLIGVANTVKVFEAKTGKDVTDHLEAGHALKELVQVQPDTLPTLSPAKGSAAPPNGEVASLAFKAVLGALAQLGRTVPPSEPGGDYQVCCPVHGDTNPSATVKVGDTQPVVFHCHKGCTQEEFVDALVELGVSKALLMENTKGPFDGLSLTPLSNVKGKLVHWLWWKRIAYGKIVNFEGDPELGKSLVTLTFAAIATRGGRFPDGAQVEKAAVIIMSTEDDFEDTIVPRLEAAEADRTICFQLPVRRSEKNLPIPFVLPDDTAFLEAMIQNAKDQSGLNNVIVIVDPAASYLSEKVNSHNDASVRTALGPLGELASKSGACFWLVRHLNKNSKEKNVKYRSNASIGFFAAARHVFLFGEIAEDPTRIYMAQSKNNIGPQWTKDGSFCYHIEASDSEAEDPPPIIRWDGQSKVSKEEILQGPDGRMDAPQRGEAEKFLAEMLKDVDEIEVEEAMAQGKTLGISRRTVSRAAQKFGLISERERGEKGQTLQWVYRYPFTAG